MFRRSIVPIVALVCLVGCTTPMEKAHTVSTLYAQGQTDLLSQRQLGLIPDDTFNAFANADAEITPIIREMNRAAIQAQTENVPFTKTFNFNTIYDKARAKVNEFLLKLALAKQNATPK